MILLSNQTSLRARRILYLARHAVLPVYALEGDCRGVPLRMLAADDGSTLSYIRSLAFPNGSSLHKKGAIDALRAPSLVGSGADVVVVGANHRLLDRYSRSGFHLVPKWVCPSLRLTGDPDSIIANLGYDARKDIRRNLRQALERGFTYELTNDRSWFDIFYRDAYTRYGESRHGELADLDSYDTVRSAFLRGTGMVLTLDGSPVMGSVVCREGTALRAKFMGVYPGKDEEASGGTPTAMYYFTMELAHKWGCTSINLGATRPFLSDGVLRFKMKWEPEILENELETAVFAIATPGTTPAARKFIESNPFFEKTEAGLCLFKPSEA